MFGKKSSSGAKSKPKKSIKQGPKVNFFAAHAEKLVLGLVVGLLGFLVYEGFGGKTYDQSRQPTQLAEKATSISNNIRNGDPWPVLKDEVPAVDHGYTPKTEAARKPTDEKIYGAFPMGGAGGQPFVKRGDPELMAPTKIVGQSVIGLIAVEAPDEYVDPFEDFDDAVKLKGKATGSAPARQRKGADALSGGSEGSGSGGMGMGMGMGDMGGGLGGGMGGGMKRLFPSKYNRGFSLGGSSSGSMGMGMGSGMGSGEGSGMDMGMGMGMGSGSMGGSGGGAVAGTTGGLNGAVRPKTKKIKAEPILFNAITALVPHEDLVKEYEAKLRESASFNAMRDMPIYLDFEYERCEVNDKAPNQPETWVKRGSARDQLNMMKKWLPFKPQQIPEVIDMTSYDRALTMPIPPLLMQDYRKFAKHPDIDWIWDAGMNMAATMQTPMTEVVPNDNSDQFLPGEQPMGAGGMMGGGMMGGSGSMGGSGAMGGGAMGMGSGMEMGAGMGMGSGGMDMGMGMGMGMGSEGGSGGMGGSMMGGSMMGGGMMGGMNFMPAKYKMVRFYDKLEFADVGKTFKYRIRLIMEDPNYPSDRFPSPPANDMEQKVFARVSALRAIDDPIVDRYRLENAKAIQTARANKTVPKLKFHTRKKLEGPWSAASKGIYVRGIDDVYVNKMGKKQVSPEVEAVIVRLDYAKGAYVPMYFFVEDEEALKKQAEEKDKDAKPPKISKATVPAFKRGAVIALAGPLTTEFAHPITNVIKRWMGYSTFDKRPNTVVDIRGGDPLAGSKAQEDPLSDNVEMMMLMSDGRVEVTTEFDDASHYRGFTLADEREAAEKGTGAGAASMGMGMGSGGEDAGSGRR